jgi:polysaccharide export outer membrane protein
MNASEKLGRLGAILSGGLAGLVLALTGCATPPTDPAFQTDLPEYEYIIGPGDSLNIFVWRNPEVSQTVTVRPDGKLSTPLVEDLVASGKTPTQLARELEEVLSTFIKDPLVTVIVGGFTGRYDEQVRVIGEAASPQALPYKVNMTLLDVMIAVGGLTDFADGNQAVLARKVEGDTVQTRVRLEDLIRDGDITANMDIRPGDILIIPEAWF